MWRRRLINRSMALFCADQHGATAIEYALIAAVLSLGLLLGVETIGDGVVGQWSATILPAIAAAMGG